MEDRYYAYVDESGDRGWSQKSSECFILTATIVHAFDTDDGKTLLERVRTDLNKPTGTVLSLKDNVKRHDERRHVADLIGGSDWVTVCSVVTHKPSLRKAGAKGLQDHETLYNWAIRLLLERLSWFANATQKPLTPVFSYVRKFPYARLHGYLELLRERPTEIKWQFLGVPKIEQPNKIELLQLADLASGLVYQAFKPDRFGAYEGAYLLRVAPRLYRLGSKVSSYGLKCQPEVLEEYEWWGDLQTLWS